MRPAGSCCRARTTPRSTSTSIWRASIRARTRSTTSSMRTPGSPRCSSRPGQSVLRERSRNTLWPGLEEHRGDPGVRILDVVDRVLARMLARQIEVEVDRGVVRARQQEPAGRIHADLLQEILERDELARAL